MKTLKQHELERVAGGYSWKDFKEDWRDLKDDVRDGWKAFDDGLSDNGSLSDSWRRARNAARNN